MKSLLLVLLLPLAAFSQTQVVGVGGGGSASVAGGSCASGYVVSAISASAVPTCVPASTALLPTASAADQALVSQGSGTTYTAVALTPALVGADASGAAATAQATAVSIAAADATAKAAAAQTAALAAAAADATTKANAAQSAATSAAATDATTKANAAQASAIAASDPAGTATTKANAAQAAAATDATTKASAAQAAAIAASDAAGAAASAQVAATTAAASDATTKANHAKEPGTLYADDFSGADASVKINACRAQVIANGGGACDARNLGGTAFQVLSQEIDAGDSSGSAIPFTLYLPPKYHWAFSMTGGTACGIKTYNGTSIYQQGVGAGGAQGILDTAASAALESMICTDNSTTAFKYVHLEMNAAIQSNGPGSTLTKAVDMRNFADQTLIDGMDAVNSIGDGFYFENIGCGTVLNRLHSDGWNGTGNGNTGGVPITIAATSLAKCTGSAVLSNSSFNRAKSGDAEIVLGQASGGVALNGLLLLNDYSEGNCSDGTNVVDPSTEALTINQNATGVLMLGGKLAQACLTSTNKPAVKNYSTSAVQLINVSQGNGVLVSDIYRAAQTNGIQNSPNNYPEFAAVFNGSGPSHTAGQVPDPGSTAGTTRYLREDGSFAVPPGGSSAAGTFSSPSSSATTYTQATTDVAPNGNYVPLPSNVTAVTLLTPNSTSWPAGTRTEFYNNSPNPVPVTSSSGVSINNLASVAIAPYSMARFTSTNSSTLIWASGVIFNPLANGTAALSCIGNSTLPAPSTTAASGVLIGCQLTTYNGVANTPVLVYAVNGALASSGYFQVANTTDVAAALATAQKTGFQVGNNLSEATNTTTYTSTQIAANQLALRTALNLPATTLGLLANSYTSVLSVTSGLDHYAVTASQTATTGTLTVGMNAASPVIPISVTGAAPVVLNGAGVWTENIWYFCTPTGGTPAKLAWPSIVRNGPDTSTIPAGSCGVVNSIGVPTPSSNAAEVLFRTMVIYAQ